MDSPNDDKPASPPGWVKVTAGSLVTVIAANALGGAHHTDSGHALPPEEHVELRAVTSGERSRIPVIDVDGAAGTSTASLPVGEQELSLDVMRQLWLKRANGRGVAGLHFYRYPFLDT